MDSLAKKITSGVSVPTIGIGAGNHTDGQVLVLHDLLGFDSSFKPKFLKQYAKMGDLVLEALNHYVDDVKEKRFPTVEQTFLE